MRVKAEPCGKKHTQGTYKNVAVHSATCHFGSLLSPLLSSKHIRAAGMPHWTLSLPPTSRGFSQGHGTVHGMFQQLMPWGRTCFCLQWNMPTGSKMDPHPRMMSLPDLPALSLSQPLKQVLAAGWPPLKTITPEVDTRRSVPCLLV